MKIPGWWRVRHFYYRVIEFFKEISKYIDRRHEDYLYWKNKNKVVKEGVNIIGFAKGDFGLAEHMRLVTHSVKTTIIKFCVNDSSLSGDHSVGNKELVDYIIDENPFRINLFCYNPNFIFHYMKDSHKGKIAVKKHYNISYGYWELSKYPKDWNEQNSYMQEIWAPSKFIKEVIEKETPLPVFYMPIPVDFVIPTGHTRTQFGLPENRFLFLFTFDLSSVIHRKNPEAVIEAFTRAFPSERKDGVALVIKINRIKSNEQQGLKVAELREQVSFDDRILLIDEVLDRSSILGLINVCDAYVSLHRSEGFGLGMAEAMKMGKVVIGTNYSGNTDFMNAENSCLVNYKLMDVKKEEYVFVEDGAQWADPDIDHAAEYMQKVYSDPALVKRLGMAAKEYMDNHRNFKVIGENYQKRLNEIEFEQRRI